MNPTNLHVVSFDVPYPPDYGGVIDVFYRLKALSEQGIKIKLHCFDYGRGKSDELEQIAEKVYYYRRSFNLINHFSAVPFIVKSRMNRRMLNNLLDDRDPIWFEGVHTCGYIEEPRLKNRAMAVRLHNDEAEYYTAIAKSEKGIIKSTYHRLEAFKLRLFEKKLQYADILYTISKKDQSYFKERFKNVHYLPAFIGKEEVKIELKPENYSLYHGNLQVAENQQAVDFLLSVFKELPYQLIIAGKNPSKHLKAKIAKLKNVDLVENPNGDEMNKLISEAKLSCLPTFQSTGVKLKLMNALKLGGFVLVNSAMVKGTDLKKYCELADTKSEWTKKIEELINVNIQEEKIIKRKREINEIYNNKVNADQIVEWLAQAQ